MEVGLKTSIELESISALLFSVVSTVLMSVASHTCRFLLLSRRFHQRTASGRHAIANRADARVPMHTEMPPNHLPKRLRETGVVGAQPTQPHPSKSNPPSIYTDPAQPAVGLGKHEYGGEFSFFSLQDNSQGKHMEHF